MDHRTKHGEISFAPVNSFRAARNGASRISFEERTSYRIVNATKYRSVKRFTTQSRGPRTPRPCIVAWILTCKIRSGDQWGGGVPRRDWGRGGGRWLE